MQLDILQKFASFLKANPPKKLRLIKRIGDSLFKFIVDEEVFFIDLSRGKSTIFTTNSTLIAPKIYQAPFDKSLQKYCYNALILDAKVNGFNRILQIALQTKNSYKSIEITLQMEFTGRNTNLILLDSKNIVLDAMRHITKEQSFREVRIARPLLPLPEPKKIPKIIDNGELQDALRENFINLQNTQLHNKIQNATAQITQKIKHLHAHLHALENKDTLKEQAKLQTQYGQAILQNLYLYPNFKGKTITLNTLQIPLPSQARSLSEAAQIFFAYSKKLSKKANNIHIQEQNLKEKIVFYENLSQLIQNVTNLSDLQILTSNLQKDRDLNKPQRQERKIFENFFIEGIKISIGKNERENIALLKEAKADDIWMHIRNIPGAHCIIHCGKSKISDIILYKAAQILIGFTKSFSANYTIDYTKRKFVKIIQGANVIYGKEQTLDLKKD